MKFYALKDIPFTPVSHDPALKKQVMAGPDVLPGIRNFSHIRLPSGSRASEHAHPDGFEVFYCIGGEVLFRINGEDVSLRERECLVVEPGEKHSIEDASEAELVYFFLMLP